MLLSQSIKCKTETIYNLFASIFLHFGKFAFVNLELLLVFFYIYFVIFFWLAQLADSLQDIQAF